MEAMIDILLSPSAWLFALGIFLARMVNIAMDTLRIMFTMRQKSGIAWVLGFIESTIYILLIGSVLTNIGNPLNIIGYSAGFATGNVLGMAIEKRLALGYMHFNIISRHHSTEIADALRNAGFGVTDHCQGARATLCWSIAGSGVNNPKTWKTWCLKSTRRLSSLPKKLFLGAAGLAPDRQCKRLLSN